MMDDDFEADDGPKETLSETKRVSRNMNEKKRRDRFNVLISELAAVIPDSSAVGSSKIDKTTVLKKAVAYLRSHSSRSTVALCRPTANWQPAFVNDTELNQVLLEAMSGFILVLDGSGIITFASDSMISVLGYRPQDVVNNSIADYLDQTDKSCIFAHLALLEKLKSSTQDASNSTYSSVAVSEPVNFEMTLNSGPCFKSQMTECFSCIGQAFTTNNACHSSSKFQVTVICYSSNSKTNLTQPLFEVTSKEFTSKLSLDWKFTCVDTRIMLVLGYQPSELLHKSIYAFIHHDDLVNIKAYHEMLVRKGRIKTCYYRFLTKGEVWIWLRSCCHISYNQWNSKPEYVTVKSNPVHFEEVFSNQEVLVKNDRLHFQSIARDFRSESCIKIHTKRADSPLSFTSERTEDQAGGNSTILSLFSHARRGDKTEEGKDSATKDSEDSLFSAFPVPEGLSPAQYKLHMQLQGKHQLLENSIKNQITELNKIKRQIDINRQLWEFNRQLQEKKALKLGKGSSLSSSRKSFCDSDKVSTNTVDEDMDTSNSEAVLNSPSNMMFPETACLTIDDFGEGLEPPSIPISLNTSSQLFAPPQPYNYFQF